ncbi:uncharacterized protein LOC136090155 [Hydra vulgaris]|uniref:Uncharacterized protein LOC136090155 n=1 Tax=Hydra vulgaris TaxID=6087 RepID=A0ABM4DD74_HYDVU
MRFKAKNPSLTLKRQGNVSINRALNCTREMACLHLDALAEELIETGIMTEAVQKGTGVWSGNIDTCRIFNHDETPQFINFGVDGTPAGLVFAAKGETCCKMIRENRECVTIHPLVSFSGDLCVCQVLFGTLGITNQMAPKEAVVSIPHLLITTCNHGVSDLNSLLDMYKEFDEYLTEKKVARPVVLPSDGHCSRFNFDVLKFLQSKNIRMFLTPPDTTGVTQLLDQLNKNLHHEYRGMKENIFTDFNSLNKEAFMMILGRIWNNWAPRQSIIKAARRVGVTSTSLSVNDMQQDKFARAALYIDFSKSVTSSTTTPGSYTIKSPDKRKNSAQYWKEKFERSQELIQELSEKSIQLEEIPGLLTVQKVKPKVSKLTTRVTQVHGSMKGKNVLDLVKVIQDNKNQEIKDKEEKRWNKEKQKEAFLRCKNECSCGEGVCHAIKLQQCSSCHNVKKSVCGKLSCKVDGKKPIMFLAAAVTNNSLKRKVIEHESDEDTRS